jgi:hypothetical protein
MRLSSGLSGVDWLSGKERLRETGPLFFDVGDFSIARYVTFDACDPDARIDRNPLFSQASTAVAAAA